MNRQYDNRYDPGYNRYQTERENYPEDRWQDEQRQDERRRRYEADRAAGRDVEHPDHRNELGREMPRQGWGNYRGGNPSNWGNEGFYSGYEGVQTAFNGGHEPRNPGDFSHERHIVNRASFAGRGPKGYTRSDERIREDVNDQLTDHHGVDASDIEVRVQNGEVTLTGTAPDRMAKRIAEDCALAVRGVKDVHNQIRVQQSTGIGSSESARTTH